jgi:hypothetical protein
MVLTASDYPVRIAKKTKKRLDALKVHPRQSYDEVINKLIDAQK